MPQKHSRMTLRGREFWFTDRLWKLSYGLEIKSVAIDSIVEFDENCWFESERPPTCKEVARHAMQIYEADLSYPVILNRSGGLMDGGHRLCKAWISGRTQIDAVQFLEDPEPDSIVSSELDS